MMLEQVGGMIGSQESRDWSRFDGESGYYVVAANCTWSIGILDQLLFNERFKFHEIRFRNCG
jgi:hypothetical protein